MSNTTNAKGNTMTDTTTTARQLGTDAGRNAGSWVIDGNTDDDTIRRIVNGYNDGDPKILDMMPSPLSGEFAGSPTPRDILWELGIEDDDDDAADWQLDEYESAYADAFWQTVIDAAAHRGIGTVRAILAAEGIDPETHHVVRVAQLRQSTNVAPYTETRDVLVFNHAVKNDLQGDDPLSVGNFAALEGMWSELVTASPYSNADYFAIDMDDTAPAELVDVINSLADYPCLDDELMSQAELELAEEHWSSYGRRDTFAELATQTGIDADDLEGNDVIAGLVDAFTFSGGHQCDASGDYLDIYPSYIDPSAFEFNSADVAAAIVTYVNAWLAAEEN